MERGGMPQACFRTYVFAQYAFRSNGDKPRETARQKFQPAISKLGQLDVTTYIGVWVKESCLECPEREPRLCTLTINQNTMGSFNRRGRNCTSKEHKKGVEIFLFLAEFTPAVRKIIQELEADEELNEAYSTNLEFHQGLASTVRCILSYIKKCGAKHQLCRNYNDLTDQCNEMDKVTRSKLNS